MSFAISVFGVLVLKHGSYIAIECIHFKLFNVQVSSLSNLQYSQKNSAPQNRMSLQFKERLCASVLFIDKTIIIVTHSPPL